MRAVPFCTLRTGANRSFSPYFQAKAAGSGKGFARRRPCRAFLGLPAMMTLADGKAAWAREAGRKACLRRSYNIFLRSVVFCTSP